MRKMFLTAGSLFFFFSFAVSFLLSQSSGVAKSDPTQEIQRALDLARTGYCREALPLLRKATGRAIQVPKELKKQAGLAGVHCAMADSNVDAASEFLRGLSRDFPRDPEVLFLSVHTYSDL